MIRRTTCITQGVDGTLPGSHHLECVVSGGVNTFDVLSSMDALLGRALIA